MPDPSDINLVTFEIALPHSIYLSLRSPRGRVGPILEQLSQILGLHLLVERVGLRREELLEHFPRIFLRVGALVVRRLADQPRQIFLGTRVVLV